MEKRLPLALFLSFLIFMAWTLTAPRPETERGKRPKEAGPAPASEEEPRLHSPELPDLVSEPITEEGERELVLEVGEPDRPGRYRAVFSNRGARLVELRLGNYFDRGDLSAEERSDVEHWVRILAPFETLGVTTGSLELAGMRSAEELLRGTALEKALWRMEPVRDEEGHDAGVDFSYDPGSGVVFHKRVRFVPGEYRIQVELGLENRASELSGERSFRFTPAAVVPRSAEDSFYVEPHAVAAWRSPGAREPDLVSKERKEAPGKDLSGALGGAGAFSFGGGHSKYFALLLHPGSDDPQAGAAIQGARYRRLFDVEWRRANPTAEKGGWSQVVCDLDLSLWLPERGESLFRGFELYAGPKNRGALVAPWPDHQVLIDKDLGMFSPVAKVILGILGLYEGLVGNWGWAIILMTFTVRLLLFPLNRRSQTAMARYQSKMKRIQPKLEELKKRLEKDPQKLRQEQARLMQEEGAFPPLQGCLPIFLQMPVFIGLFQALRVDFDLRHAPFLLWIQDLSMPDRLLELGIRGLPLAGDMLHYLNILPILMIVLWILQQRAMPKPTDEQQARMQKMMLWMPVLFGIFLYNYAAGLSLYMITSSSLGIFEMRVIKKVWPVDDREVARKKSGFMARLAEMQKEHMRRMEHGQRGQAGRRGQGGRSGSGGGRRGPGGKGKKGRPVG